MDTRQELTRARHVETLEEPPIARALFANVRWAWIWLILRLYLGWQWLQSGWGKWQNPAWTGDNAGAAIGGFVSGALQRAEGERPAVQGWYAWFLETAVQPYPVTWSYMIATGELLVGIALIIGLFTGIAAFFGSFMNANFLLAGTVGSNPIFLAIAILLILAWRTAGWWGLDRWVLPALGTPWSPGLVFREERV